MVDTGAMVSLIQPGISKVQVQPCDVQARGVTGTQLDILGEQEVRYNLRSNDGYMTCVHTFVVSHLKRCSSGILGMDFLQRVGAEISLTAQLLCIGRYSLPLKGQELEFSEVQHLITAGQTESLCLDQEERGAELVGDWEGTVELAETVTVPPLSVRIARCRVVRRNDSVVVKVPRNEAVLIDPEGLPRIYTARIVATLDVCGFMSSSNASGSDPPVVGKSPLVEIKESPRDKFIVSSDGNAPVTSSDGGFLQVVSGECLPELPESGAPVAATCHRDDIQAESGSLPVENRYGNQVDTLQIHAARIVKGETEGQIRNEEIKDRTSTITKRKNIQRRIQVLGYAPIQVVNLSLEEAKLEKQMYVGVASPIKVKETQDLEGYNVNTVQRENAVKHGDIDKHLQEELAHLKGKDRSILEVVLRRYEHLFCGLRSEELGCTSQVEHSIDTGKRDLRRKILIESLML